MPSICTLHPHTSKLTARVCLLKQRAEVRVGDIIYPGKGPYLQRKRVPVGKRHLRRLTVLVFFDAVKKSR